MIGTTGATILFAVIVLFAAVLGVGAGGLTCLVLRQTWGLKVAVIDAALAAVAAVIAAYVGSAIEVARGVLDSGVTLVLVVAIGSVVAMHILRRLLRPSLG